MYKVYDVSGAAGGECFLVIFDKYAVLYDTGYFFSADKTYENIIRALGNKTLSYIMLSHSHYDHVGGCFNISTYFPQSKVIASAHADKVFKKLSARVLMRELDHKAAERANMKYPSEELQCPKVDLVVGDGEEIPFEEDELIAIESIGHTNCSMSFYFKEHGLLFASETLGVPFEFPNVSSAFIVSYEKAMEALRRAKSLNPNAIIATHYGLLQGNDVRLFFEHSLDSMKETFDFVMEKSQETSNIDKIVQKYKEKFYTQKQSIIHPEEAFILNTKSMITNLIAMV